MTARRLGAAAVLAVLLVLGGAVALVRAGNAAAPQAGPTASGTASATALPAPSASPVVPDVPTPADGRSGPPTPSRAEVDLARAAPACPAVQRVVLGARTYWLCPADRPGPAPLVVVVHGYTTTPHVMDAASGWSAYGRREGFATAFPLGVGNSWDAGGCCGDAARAHTDDVAFLAAVVRDARIRVPVSRAYYVGFSNGAMLGYRLACGDAGPFAAFVGVAGTAVVPTCAPRSPRPLLAINGLADGLVPYRGCTVQQPVTGCADRLHVDLPAVRLGVDALRRAAQCTGVRMRRLGPHAVRFDPTGCARPSASSVVVDDLDHDWPRDPLRYGVDATAYAWAFLQAR